MERKRKDLDDFMEKLNAEFGIGTAMKLNKAPKVDVDVISTGSFSLDRALGCGGLPRGRIVEIYGNEATGKTTLALSVVAEAQKKGGKAAFIDAEHALNPDYATRMGVQLDGLAISQPDSGEEALNLIIKFIESNTVDVIVLDSVAALVSRAELEGDVGKQLMGEKARMMGQAIRKMTGLAAKAGVLIIFINQIRMKMGGLPFMNPETTPGGMALKFACSVRIEIRKTDKIKDKEEIIGNNVKAKIVKNKVGIPFKVAEFSLVFGQGIDYELDVLNVAIEDEIVKKDGNSYLFGDERLGVGLGNSRKRLKEEPELLVKLVAALNHVDLEGPLPPLTGDRVLAPHPELERPTTPAERRKARRAQRNA
jgi:recombination protein RecA